MSSIAIIGLVAANLGLLFLLLAAPLGSRTITMRRVIKASRQQLWDALFPLGAHAGWSGEIVSVTAIPGEALTAVVGLSWEGRDGRPIERTLVFGEVIETVRFSLHVADDSSLDRSFWSNYRETVSLADADGATEVVLQRTDSYRGAAFLVFRYFAMRREMRKLKSWAETGRFRKGGIFEHPLTQVGFATLSALLIWPLFGLTLGGFALAAILTSVVALHELGHMAAFRLMGHRRVRMIFIPLLGGIAIGGRPYDSRFEVAFVAMMGAGFSAFLIPIVIEASLLAREAGYFLVAALLATLVGFAALFNIANLVPVWKFDGGQVLRQICGSPLVLATASFVLVSAFIALGFKAGAPSGMLLFAGAVFGILSLLTGGSGVKPRHELKPIGLFDRLAIAAALLAIFAIHGYGVLWATARLV